MLDKPHSATHRAPKRYASQSQMQQEAFLRKKNPNLSATGSTEDLKLLEKVKLKSKAGIWKNASDYALG